MTGKNISIVPGGKTQVMTPADYKQAADAERERCRAEGYDMGLKQGRHEAHHARKYVQIGLAALAFIVGMCAGTLFTAGMYEDSMARGVMLGGAVTRQEEEGRLTLTDQYTRQGER